MGDVEAQALVTEMGETRNALSVVEQAGCLFVFKRDPSSDVASVEGTARGTAMVEIQSVQFVAGLVAFFVSCLQQSAPSAMELAAVTGTGVRRFAVSVVAVA